MNKLKSPFVILVASCLVAGPVPSAVLQASTANHPAAASAPTPPTWPRTFDANGAHIIVYQPQLKSWRAYRTLVADTAVSIAPSGAKPILGVISFKADTIADVSARTVYISNIQIIDSRFPSLDPASETAIQQRVHQFYPTMTLTISLDRMIASIEKVNAPAPAIATSTQVPPIFGSTSPPSYC